MGGAVFPGVDEEAVDWVDICFGERRSSRCVDARAAMEGDVWDSSKTVAESAWWMVKVYNYDQGGNE